MFAVYVHIKFSVPSSSFVSD